MKKTKKTKTPAAAPPSGDVRRVNMTLTVDEYERLEAAASKVQPVALAPTVMAKLLVMKALEAENPLTDAARA